MQKDLESYKKLQEFCKLFKNRETHLYALPSLIKESEKLEVQAIRNLQIAQEELTNIQNKLNKRRKDMETLKVWVAEYQDTYNMSEAYQSAELQKLAEKINEQGAS